MDDKYFNVFGKCFLLVKVGGGGWALDDCGKKKEEEEEMRVWKR